MPLFSVPVTLIGSIDVFATDKGSALYEARRYAEALETGGHYKDGWNDVQRSNHGPIIDDCSGFDVEGIDLAEVEEMPARWVIEPQRDDNGPGLSSVAGTHFVKCDEDRATQWAIFERDATDCADAELVEDYPTRAAAEAAVAALEADQPLPDPVWPDKDAAIADAAYNVRNAIAFLEAADLSHFEGLYDRIPWRELETIAAKATRRHA